MSVLELQTVAKAFGGFRVLRDVSLTMCKGQVLVLIGPNGAGKSTLFKLIMGFLRLDQGQILLKGRSVTSLPAFRRQRLGLAMAHQASRIIPQLTAVENMLLAVHPWRGQLSQVFRRDCPAAARRRVDEVLALLGLADHTDTLAGALPHGCRKLLDLGTAIVQDPALLLLDEPTAGLAAEEIEVVTAIIKRLKQHCAILIVEHDMQFVRRLDEWIVVLHEGRIVRDGDIATLEQDPLIREIYFGNHIAGADLDAAYDV